MSCLKPDASLLNKRTHALPCKVEHMLRCQWMCLSDRSVNLHENPIEIDRPIDTVQAGTSHDLGDNFARAFGTQFLNEEGDLVHPQQSSWGASTRLIGGIIMTHGAVIRALASCHACGIT